MKLKRALSQQTRFEHTPGISTAVLLFVLFSCLYTALGPGCMFSVDEVVVEEMAQSVFLRGTLEVPTMNTARPGLGGNYYAHRGPALGYTAMPLVAFGTLLDDRWGSIKGTAAAGPPIGTPEHPLRWGGRIAIFMALITNALFGAVAVALLYLIGLRLGFAEHAAILGATVFGLSTLLASESTHFFQHVLSTVGLLAGFWLLSDRAVERLRYRMVLGPLALGLSFLARPDAIVPAAILWIYGLASAWQTLEKNQRKQRMLIPTALAVIGPLLCAFFYLYYNWLQFGSAWESGNDTELAFFDANPVSFLRGIATYLFSPTLSVFLFSPALVLLVLTLRQSRRRWPLETTALLLAAGAQLLFFSFYQNAGGIAYGPRFLLAATVLVLPLTLPAVEQVFRARDRISKVALGSVAAVGFFVQLLGFVVYVTSNEWYRMQQGINDGDRWVFVPSASPVLVHLRNLLGGENIIPWALRAWRDPGPALGLWCFLVVVIAGGARVLFRRFQESRGDAKRIPGKPSYPDGLRFVEAVIVTILLLTLSGVAMTRPKSEPLEQSVSQLLVEGLQAQRVGRDVAAEESYALILGVNPANRFALYNMALLNEKAGNVQWAIQLHQRALQTDRSFAPAAGNLSRLLGRPVALAEVSADTSCGNPADCYHAGKGLWDSGDKAHAAAVWSEAARRFPRETHFYRNAARALYDLGDYPGAVADYKRAVAQLPGDPGVLTDLAWALLKAGSLDEAREICSRVLANDPGNANAKAILAEIARMGG